MNFLSLRSLLFAILGTISGAVLVLSYHNKTKQEETVSYLDNFPSFRITYTKAYANPIAYAMEVTIEFDDFTGKSLSEYQKNQIKEAFFIKYFKSVSDNKGTSFKLEGTNISEGGIPQKDILKLYLHSDKRSNVLEVFKLIETLDKYHRENAGEEVASNAF